MKYFSYLLLFLTVSFSCIEKGEKKPLNPDNKVASASKDALAFTSGIRAILKDSKGFFWFGSMQEGLCRYDGNSFVYYTTKDGLADNQIRSIQEDSEGTLWLGTGNGVCSYDGKSFTIHTAIEEKTSGEWFPVQKDKAQSKWMKKSTDLWFNAGIKEGIYRYDGEHLHYLPFPEQSAKSTGNVYSVTDFSHGQNNMLWIGTFAGVFGFDGKDFITINNEALEIETDEAPVHIRSVLEDSKGRLWIGNNGIGVLLKQEENITNFSEEQGLIHPNSSRRGDPSPPGTLEHVFCITEDRTGNIWFADRDAGVWKYDGKNMINYTTKDGLTSNFAQSIYEDPTGVLWFGLVDGNLCTFNGKSFDSRF